MELETVIPRLREILREYEDVEQRVIRCHFIFSRNPVSVRLLGQE